jgi:hypothetical protein
MFGFNIKYFVFAISLFIIEVLIALYMHDAFIRPYAGDFLVVILLYCMVRSIWQDTVLRVAIPVLIFSYIVETLQYFNFVKLIGLQHSRLANIVIGNHFAWEDIIAYTLGILVVILIERFTRSAPQIYSQPPRESI